MCRPAGIVVLFMQAVLIAGPPSTPQDPTPGTVVLKSATHAVQLDVLVTDPSGQPVHGLQKSDFAVTDNGRPRDIRIFAREMDVDQTTLPAVSEPPPGMYSNRRSMREARLVTAIVIDAAPRPEGLQKNAGVFESPNNQWFWFSSVRSQARHAIHLMQPGQAIAIYAACPELRVVQDYTFDPDRLIASLNAFVQPRLPKSIGKRQPQTIDTMVPPMLSALREAAVQLSRAPGRKSVVWISQAYGTELNLSAIGDATDAAVDAFTGANIPLYAVDARFSASCPGPEPIAAGESVTSTCFQPPDVSDQWMRYLADATGGREFGPGKVTGTVVRSADASGHVFMVGANRIQTENGGLISDALRFAIDDSRYAYEIGFYVPESELDGKVHTLRVSVPNKPKFDLHYRSGYTASASATGPPSAQELSGPDSVQEPAGPLNPLEIGIDAKVDLVPGAKNELQVSLALTPESVTRTADGVVVLDAVFTQTDVLGKQLAKVQDTVRISAPEMPNEMVPYSRTVKRINGAALLHIRIRDQASNRAGTVTIPIKQ